MNKRRGHVQLHGPFAKFCNLHLEYWGSILRKKPIFSNLYVRYSALTAGGILGFLESNKLESWL